MTPDDHVLRAQIKKEFVNRLLISFLDIIIMAHFREESFSGYDAIRFIQEQFSVLLSSGTVYSAIHAMKAKAYVTSRRVEGKTVYALTDKGRLAVDVVTSSAEIGAFMARIMRKQPPN